MDHLARNTVAKYVLKFSVQATKNKLKVKVSFSFTPTVER